MRTSTAIKMFAIAIVATATLGVSNANAEHRNESASSCNSGRRFVQPPMPVLGIYGRITSQGMLVTDVVRGTEAWEIGLERGDVIVEIDGRHIHSQRDYDIAMSRAGRHTNLRVLDARGRGIVTVQAHLDAPRLMVR